MDARPDAWACGPRPRPRSRPRCVWSAARTASSALPNTDIAPSPSRLTRLPPWSEIASSSTVGHLAQELEGRLVARLERPRRELHDVGEQDRDVHRPLGPGPVPRRAPATLAAHPARARAPRSAARARRPRPGGRCAPASAPAAGRQRVAVAIVPGKQAADELGGRDELRAASPCGERTRAASLPVCRRPADPAPGVHHRSRQVMVADCRLARSIASAVSLAR